MLLIRQGSNYLDRSILNINNWAVWKMPSSWPNINSPGINDVFSTFRTQNFYEKIHDYLLKVCLRRSIINFMVSVELFN